MRFLKMKIQKAQDALKKRLSESETSSQSSQIQTESDIPNSKSFQRNERITRLRSYKPNSDVETKLPERKKEDASMKNIAVNYANAITSFAVSNLAIPYLRTRLQDEDIILKDFVSFIKHEKGKIGGICSFRARLLADEKDNAKIAACKRIFQWIAEVFIKYFSVNWIIHGRVSHKETYLKFRFKMLRRVRSPELFTYIKERTNTKI